jgi:WD40 repeat protein
MFKNEDFFIFGNNYEQIRNNNNDRRMCVWNKNGALIKKMNKSNLNGYVSFIEATYFEDKNYILLSGQNFSECYNFDEDDVKTYQDNENESYIYCINLFKKGNDIYFITGIREKVNIFEFESTKLIKRIQLGEKEVYSLCSINEKYVIASNSSKLKIIDMEKYSVVKDFSAYEDDGEDHEIMGIEKIKIPEKGEFIITYSDKGIIRIWKM